MEANRLFNTISTDYNQLKAAATEATAAATGPAANNRVAWISKFADTLTMSYAVYKQQLVTVSGQLRWCGPVLCGAASFRGIGSAGMRAGLMLFFGGDELQVGYFPRWAVLSNLGQYTPV